jgi:6-pyruvoyltetrahydropterin/6-carboxytetrahydropterin synthase
VYTVCETVFFCYGHRLIGYPGKCAHAHGHNARVEIHLGAESLDALGMVADFEEIGRTMKAWIDAQIDHRMLLRRDDPLVAALQSLGEPVFLMDENPTAEAIARLLFDVAEKGGLPVREIRVWETEQSVAAYAPPR